MEYQVPQFIEVEDKIFGPLTLRQFIYIAGGVGLCAILFLYVPLFFAIILAIPVAALALALAFYKVNGKEFALVLEAGVTYFLGHRLYLWRKEKGSEEAKKAAEEAAAVPLQASLQSPALTRRKLEDLAWALDVRNTGTSESP